MTVREEREELERLILSPRACPARGAGDRKRPEEPDPTRTCFQRDLDRVVHSKAFRRLKHKTQVFLQPEGDHYRTRMTHTIEVARIARTIARALRLNEDLTEAIAFGHDLGHTPFGHAGESEMQKLFSPDFTHYRQSLRVVEKLENNGKGLNLTWEVRDGIVNHTGNCMAATLEGVIVKYADRIAYINHDIDDACRAGILKPTDIPADLRKVLGETHGERINRMVRSVIEASTDRPEIDMDPEIREATDRLRKFLFEAVYTNPVAKSEEGKARGVIAALYEYYSEHPEQLPELYRKNAEEEGVGRSVCDYISCMTDRFAIETYKELFVPKVWRV